MHNIIIIIYVHLVFFRVGSAGNDTLNHGN